MCRYGSFYTRVSGQPSLDSKFRLEILGFRIKALDHRQLAAMMDWVRSVVGNKTGEDFCTFEDPAKRQIKVATTVDPKKTSELSLS